MTILTAAERRRVTTLLAGFLAVVAVNAAVVHLAAAPEVRDWLDFTFSGVPRTADQALEIFSRNARLLIAALAACVVLQGSTLIDPEAERQSPRWQATAVHVCDVVLGTLAVVNLAMIGASIGAYGDRVVKYLLPHGPIEALAFAIALALYVCCRSGAVTRHDFLRLAGLALAALIVAALLETFVTP
jgi:hypothetical protein